MKRVYTARHPIDAHLVRGLLEAAGIPAEVRGEVLFGARGELPMTEDTLPSVWVLDERAAGRALSIVHTHQEEGAAPAAGPAWQCPACGAELEPQFSTCWRCSPDVA
ncbi:MAG: DUF2007 domain-containing protein [Pseudomonadota bacterium]|nr:DUF2007 domain-containing protein [Pseudomonadota bacterium]